MSEGDEGLLLHDLSTPLSTVLLILDATLDRLTTGSVITYDEVTQITQAFEAVEKMRKLLEERKDVVAKRVTSETRVPLAPN